MPSLFADARSDRVDLSEDDDPYENPDESETPAYGLWLVGLVLMLVVLGAFYVLNPEESRQVVGALSGWVGHLLDGSSDLLSS